MYVHTYILAERNCWNCDLAIAHWSEITRARPRIHALCKNDAVFPRERRVPKGTKHLSAVYTCYFFLKRSRKCQIRELKPIEGKMENFNKRKQLLQLLFEIRWGDSFNVGNWI